MAKPIALLASALCLFALAGVAHGIQFFVEGKVYCDTCRVEFATDISKFIAGAGVKLECRDKNSLAVKVSVEGKTDENGHYRLLVEGDHKDEICEVSVVSSPLSDCNEPLKENATVSLTGDSSMLSINRFAYPIGFMKKEALPECKTYLQDLTKIL